MDSGGGPIAARKRWLSKMTGLASSPEDILRFLSACAQDGRGSVLVTLVGICGASPRVLGAQMAVASDGDYIGSLSGGCIEAAVVEEALVALASRSPRQVRFGAGSPYIDIRLPCGGGIDLLFTPSPNPAAIAEAISRLDRREPVSLEITGGGVRAVEARGPTGWRGDAFVVTYPPRLRLIIFGQGEELTATAQLAHAFGAQTEAYSPSARDIRTLRAKSIEATLLEFRAAQPGLASDPWSAIIFVFHDRDWEEALIPWALALPAFYIGALGSRLSHKKRCEMLTASGVLDEAIQAIRSPIGLVPSTRDPSTLAASILAEIVQEFTVDAALPLVGLDEEANQLIGRF
ncbi:XdhC family protein [Sphingopyxis sp.]|uniref:XdhC family protein n=1 Tax=Sphingopyxis sp. TaxID=1908224 RepID=UPI00344B1669